MRKIILPLIIALLIIWLAPTAGYAGVAEDYEEAYELQMAAAACLASYNSRTGMLAREYLSQDGWEIKPFVQSSREADARFLLAQNMRLAGRGRYILAMVGTETIKDVKVDLRTGKVYFAGRTPEEFAANAKLAGIPDTAPKVHRGFHEYVQAALTAKTSDGSGLERPLSELLLADPSLKIFLVGHSLGGAAATVAGARLLAMGVKPEQIEVITFGAPAVGNEAFAREYSPRLDLTRVVIAGDPVTGVLQKLVGGYHQFGRELVWRRSALFEQGPHAVEEYMDLALKNYYDKRTAAVGAGLVALPRESSPGTGARIYVAAPVDSLPDELKAESSYMAQALADQYRRLLPGYVLAGLDRDATPRKDAAAAGGKWYVVAEYGGQKVKNERNRYVVTLQHTVYDTASGNVVHMNSFSSVTANMTPLEALAHDAAGAVADLAAWLGRQRSAENRQ
ncbi:MAG TPA: lipase family protein [Negativicutes bacterium]|nr:lipase family protein [Negativicutes bacterium]